MAWKSSLRKLVLLTLYLLLSLSMVASIDQPHPRFFFNESDIPKLLREAQTTHRDIWEPIRDYAIQALNFPPSETAPVNGNIDDYRQFGDRLIPMAFACVIESSQELCDNAKLYLLTYAKWDQWGEYNQRGLGLAHMVMGNAIAYDWLYPYLTEEEDIQVSDNLSIWVERLYEASIQTKNEEWNNWWSDSYMQNHYTIIHSTLGVAALILEDENPRSLLWLDQAIYKLSITQELLEGIDDGSWHESMTYQSYLLSMALPFLINLKEMKNFDLIPDSYLENYVYWRLYNHLPSTFSNIFSYGDTSIEWGNSRMPQNILRYIAATYDNGYAEWLAQQLIVADGRNSDLNSVQWYVYEFLYYDPEQPLEVPNLLPIQRVFPDFEGVIWRTGWQNNDVVFGFKTGAYGGEFAYEGFINGIFPWGNNCECQLNIGHNHQDANNFTLAVGGDWLIPETVGVGLSDAQYHNTLLVDGKGQYIPPPENFDFFPEDFVDSEAQLILSVTSDKYAYLISDATHRYRNVGDLESYKRFVLRIPNNHFIIIDQMKAATRHRYESVIHFSNEIFQDQNWFLAQGAQGNTIAMQTIAPFNAQHTIGQDGYPYVHTVVEADNSVIAHLLYLPDQDSNLGLPETSLLSNNNSSIALRISKTDSITDILLALDFKTVPREADPDILDVSTTPQLTGNYTYDGLILVVEYNTEREITSIFTYGNTIITEQNNQRTIAKGMDIDQPLEIKFSGSIVDIIGRFSNPIELYAPIVHQVQLNGVEIEFERIGDYITVRDQ